MCNAVGVMWLPVATSLNTAVLAKWIDLGNKQQLYPTEYVRSQDCQPDCIDFLLHRLSALSLQLLLHEYHQCILAYDMLPLL